MGMNAGCSSSNHQRLGFIMSLSPIMTLGLQPALVCRARVPRPASIWLWEEADIGQTTMKFPQTVYIADTYNENMHVETHRNLHHQLCIQKQKR